MAPKKRKKQITGREKKNDQRMNIQKALTIAFADTVGTPRNFVKDAAVAMASLGEGGNKSVNKYNDAFHPSFNQMQ